jgi:ubiquinone/menaquinone biosynthesis C-methylase UbiE
MDARLQRRIQRYGWDLAADDYEALWRSRLAPAHAALLEAARLAPGQKVLDVACGAGAITLRAAAAVGPAGQATGVDLSGRMVEAARIRTATGGGPANLRFERMDAEALELPTAAFDAVLCSLGLMYLPDPERALAEMRRVLRPGGRLALAVWGERTRCAWAESFPIVDAEVASEVCPMFFRLGQGDALTEACAEQGFAFVGSRRLPVILSYADGGEACRAAFVGGPMALAWSRFDAETRARVEENYLRAIAPWRRGDGYAVPAEFVVVSASAPL